MGNWARFPSSFCGMMRVHHDEVASAQHTRWTRCIIPASSFNRCSGSYDSVVPQAAGRLVFLVQLSVSDADDPIPRSVD